MKGLLRVFLAALAVVLLLWLVPLVLAAIGLALTTFVVYVILFVLVALVLAAFFGTHDHHW